jgi:hypothetical protein
LKDEHILSFDSKNKLIERLATAELPGIGKICFYKQRRSLVNSYPKAASPHNQPGKIS